MVGWARGMIHSCSLSQDRHNSLASAEEFSLFCKILNLSQEVTHSSRIPLLFHGQFIYSQVSGSICFFATDSSSFLNLLSISCASFLEESIPHFQFSHRNYYFLFEPDLPFDSPDTAAIFEILVPDWFHRERYQNFFVPNVLCPCLLQPQIIFSELRILIEQPLQLFCSNWTWRFRLSDRVCTDSKSRFHFPLDKVPSTRAIDSLPRTSVPVMDRMSAPSHGFTTLAGTGCGLPLAGFADENCRRVLGRCDSGDKVTVLDVEAVSPRRKVDRRVLTADVDASLRLTTCERR